jgi:hypothetical protein
MEISLLVLTELQPGVAGPILIAASVQHTSSTVHGNVFSNRQPLCVASMGAAPILVACAEIAHESSLAYGPRPFYRVSLRTGYSD